MKTFTKFLLERYVNVGFKDHDIQLKNQYKNIIIELISKAYKEIGGCQLPRC